MIDDLIRLFSLHVDHDLNIIQHNQSLVDISTRILGGVDPILKRYRPDLVVVQGDTTSAFIGALSAFYNKIAVAHVEAGLRSFDKMQPYPEEINRRLISLVSDLDQSLWRHQLGGGHVVSSAANTGLRECDQRAGVAPDLRY